MTIEQTALILAWVAILLLAFAMSGLARQMVSLHAQGQQPAKRTSGIAVGSVAPVGHLADSDTPTVLFFAEEGCSTCEALWPLLEQLARRQPDVAWIALYTTETGHESSAVSVRTRSAEEFLAFRVHLTPYVVSIDGAGVIRFAEPVATDVGLEMAVLSVARTDEGSRVA